MVHQTTLIKLNEPGGIYFSACPNRTQVRPLRNPKNWEIGFMVRKFTCFYLKNLFTNQNNVSKVSQLLSAKADSLRVKGTEAQSF